MLAFQIVALVTVAIFVGPALFGFKGGPMGIALDGADNLYALDVTSNRVQKFSASGQFLAKLDL